jgi:hypothetical protein
MFHLFFRYAAYPIDAIMPRQTHNRRLYIESKSLLFNTIPTNPINDVNKQITPVAVTTREREKWLVSLYQKYGQKKISNTYSLKWFFPQQQSPMPFEKLEYNLSLLVLYLGYNSLTFKICTKTKN